MYCTKCEKKGIYTSLGQTYCKDHFLHYFESKVFKTIRKYKLYQKGDTIAVAASGGKDSLALLYMTMKYCKKYDLDYYALAIDEGIKEYRDHTLRDLTSFCKTYNIPLKIVSFKEKFGATLDEVQEKAIHQLKKKPCTVCGIFRRTLLNRIARELKASKLATGHNLDDGSQSFFMNTLLGNMRHNASLGPMTGLNVNKKFVQRVKPLYFILEKETRLFCFLKEFNVNFNECPNIKLSFRAVVRDQINAIEDKFPGAKNKIVNSFLEILPLLKEHYKKEKPFQYCEKCGDACAGTICNACKLEGELCLEVKSS